MFQVGQIRPFEDEFRRLRDEVEELRVKEADHSKLQQAYEQLKNKAKDSSNDRAEVCSRFIVGSGSCAVRSTRWFVAEEAQVKTSRCVALHC